MFSAERAFAYLEDFAVAPHPLGSKEHDRVRDYLIEALEGLGVDPEIQKANSLYNPWFVDHQEEQLRTLLPKLKEQIPRKTIMLVAHYDSVPGGPGVADDGAGVAAIIETVRALKEMKPFKTMSSSF